MRHSPNPPLRTHGHLGRTATAVLVSAAMITTAAACAESTPVDTGSPTPTTADVAAELEVRFAAGDAATTVGSFEVPNRAVVEELGSVLVAAAVTVDGPMPGPATVTFTLPDELDPQYQVPFVQWQNADGDLEFIAAEQRDSTVVATVEHFSGGFLGELDARKVMDAARTALMRTVTGTAGVDHPTCSDSAGFETDYQLSEPQMSDLFFACGGTEDGGAIVKITNNWGGSALIDYPADWAVLRAEQRGASVGGLADRFYAWAGTSDGRSVHSLPSAGTIVLQVNSPGEVTVDTNLGTLALDGAMIGVGLLFDLYKKGAKAAGASQEFWTAVGASWTLCFANWAGDATINDDTDAAIEVFKMATQCSASALEDTLEDSESLLGKVGAFVGTVAAAPIIAIISLLAGGSGIASAFISSLLEMLQGMDGYSLVVDPRNAQPPGDPISISQALRSAPVPSLCGHEAGALVDGSLPDAFLTPQADADVAPSVSLLDDPEPLVGDIEGDGVQEVIAVVLCVYPSYGYPTGYQSIVVWDLALNVLGAVTLEDTPPFLIAAEPSGGVTVAYTVCDPEIIVCTPIGTGSGPLARDGDSYVLLPGIAEGI